MKNLKIIISLALCIVLLLTGCGGKESNTETGGASKENSNVNTENSNKDKETTPDNSDNTTQKPSGDFDSISDISDYWNTIYTSNEKAINSYDGMPIMELVTPGLCFITGVQYDLLNINNVDGRFEGELLLAGYPGFVEKSGALLTFGYEDTLLEDGFGITSKAGDIRSENGRSDLKNGYYYAESSTDRGGVVIVRETSEFKKQANKDMCALVIDGSTMNFRGDEELKTTYIFIRGGEKLFDFVVAESEAGTAFEVLHLEDDMTKTSAIAMFEAAGAVIANSGGIKDGVFYLDDKQ